MNVRTLITEHFTHFNGGELARAVDTLEDLIGNGGAVMITLSGAMSTARQGRLLARAIRAGRIHAVTCTGANLEEDLFNALEGETYLPVAWRDLGPDDEAALLEVGLNRVTDTCIPEMVMQKVWRHLLASWQKAELDGEPLAPFTHIVRAAISIPFSEWQRPQESWVMAARDMGIPVFTPGWSDSTTGNMFSASVVKGELKGHGAVKPDTHQFVDLMVWYTEVINDQRAAFGTTIPGIGFLQIGGGIAGDWPICVVPSLRQDLGKTETIPHWSYFCQIGDAPASYGGYSGAPPNEKITWDKISVNTPRFSIQSDATICLPLMLAYLLGE